MSFKKKPAHSRSAADLEIDQEGLLEQIDLPASFAQRLMELGFIPGHPVRALRSAPSGDPRVYLVEGAEIALRRETARHLLLKAE